MTYASDFTWDVHIGPVGDGLNLRLAQDTLTLVTAVGITNMFSALTTAVEALEVERPAGARLILILSDGSSTDGSMAEFQILAQHAHAEGITISSISLGAVPEAIELMEMIANEANGRYHLALQAEELPRIMIAEGEAARSENVHEAETTLAAGEPMHPVLSGLSPAQLPTLNGYNALTSRADEGSEDILVSASLRDPILSAWQYGLGRVVAWTSDAGEAWAADWLSWDQRDLFWSQVVRYALLSPATGPARVEIVPDPTHLIVTAELQDSAGRPFNGPEPEFLYLEDEDLVRVFTLPQVAPGRYSLRLSAPPPGVYRGVLRYRYGGADLETPAPFAIDYPVEWRPVAGSNGHDVLVAWAQATGGKETALDVTPVVQEELALTESSNFLDHLLLAFILTWPFEIAIRRRWLPWH
jgi:hypothetical protein